MFDRPHSVPWTIPKSSAAWICVACLLAAGCGEDAAEAPAAETAAEAKPLRCEVLVIRPVTWPEIVRTQGSLFADEVAVVGSKVAGRVDQVHVDLGDRVAAGSPLVTLDQDEFKLAVEQAQAQLQQSRAAVGLQPGDPIAELNPENAPPVREARAVWDEAKTKNERWQQLARQNAVTEADLQAVLAAEQVAAAQYSSAINGVREKIALISVRTAELALAEQRLAETVIPAPFDGIVQERQVAPGSFVSIGSPIATFVRTDPLHFRGMMPERHARALELGQDVSLQIESVSDPRTAKVTRISPTLDPRSRSLLFEAEIGNADHRLRTGLFAEAAVIIDATSTAIAVPESAINEFAGVEKVWKVTDGMAAEQVVVTGARRDGMVEIQHGLATGDRILREADQGRVARVEEIAAPAQVATERPSAPSQAGETDSPAAVDQEVSLESSEADEPSAEATGGP